MVVDPQLWFAEPFLFRLALMAASTLLLFGWWQWIGDLDRLP